MSTVSYDYQYVRIMKTVILVFCYYHEHAFEPTQVQPRGVMYGKAEGMIIGL